MSRFPRLAVLLLPALLLPAMAASAANTDRRQPVELPPHDPSFLALEPIDAPIVDGGRVAGVLHVSIVLQTQSAEDASALAGRLPQLRAAALPAAIEFARLRASRFAPVDVARLSAALSTPIKRLSPTIKKVLIIKVSADEG